MRTHKQKKRVVIDDITPVSEDDRIRLAAHAVVVEGKTQDLIISDDPSTVHRWQRKLMARGCAIVSTIKGPAPGEATVRVGPRTPRSSPTVQ
ncbi:MAG TPA: hypothetical protein VJN70_12615 [Gemmatimonadaceae bacterium]|nr:hypothetical protein [Gemmatimonadaceae bacterium]